MHIQLENQEPYTIQTYNDNQIKVQDILYPYSLILPFHGEITPWPVLSLTELTGAQLATLLAFNPEVIIIGHNDKNTLLSEECLSLLCTHRIGLESMNIGAACRTFNVLLNEGRRVVAGFIFSTLLKTNEF